jgi:hypothetical protein
VLIRYLLVGRIAAPFPRFDRRSNRRSSLTIHAGLFLPATPTLKNKMEQPSAGLRFRHSFPGEL